MAPRFDITRVRLRNYKSIESCDVELGPLTLLVGPNGSGKSNFLDALQFVADALNTNLENAFRERGGFGKVSRFGQGEVEITVEARLGDRPYSYGIVVAPSGEDGFELREESWRTPDVSGCGNAPPDVSGCGNAPPDLAEMLARIQVFTLVPSRMAAPHWSNDGDRLLPDGSNIAGAVARIERTDPEASRRVDDYLRLVAAGVSVAGFTPSAMSTGTLHAVGVLVALFDGTAPVAIENPEKGLHPAAAGALMDAFRDGVDRHQVLLATHSSDLLDVPGVDSREILAVRSVGGKTVLGSPGPVHRDFLRKKVLTAGQMLRADQLVPEGVG
ncbi:AAA family ATPase [Kutzneria sp. CA-103260]|uniref:AAA family ATPase n=1 Tax=Kutzneria sp. CA-103260 TaxID=2802641 RepID=UPI001BAB0016|nr:AAA family ATPase [Kutzneria sp. CA-103260]QUQ70933.1 ATPase [Kutzneria sp. CA-103260]